MNEEAFLCIKNNKIYQNFECKSNEMKSSMEADKFIMFNIEVHSISLFRLKFLDF